MTENKQPALEVVALTERQIVACLVQADCLGKVTMSFDTGPYDITTPSHRAIAFAEIIGERYNALLAERDAEIARFQKLLRHQSESSANVLNTMQARIEELELDLFGHRLAAKLTRSDHDKLHKKVVTDLAEDCGKLRDRVAELEQQCDTLHSMELDSLARERDRLREEVAQLKVTVGAKTTVLRAAEKTVGELQNEVAKLKTAPIKYRRMQFNAELHDEFSALQARIAELEAKPDYQEGMYSVGAYAAELRTENDKLREEVARMREWYEDAHTGWESCKGACDALRDDLAAAQKDAERLKEKLVECHSSVKFDLTHYEKLARAYGNIGQNADAANAEANRLQAILDHIDAAIQQGEQG